jgi:hypothetical protein
MEISPATLSQNMKTGEGRIVKKTNKVILTTEERYHILIDLLQDAFDY